jgi:hypothetical protein
MSSCCVLEEQVTRDTPTTPAAVQPGPEHDRVNRTSVIACAPPGVTDPAAQRPAWKTPAQDRPRLRRGPYVRSSVISAKQYEANRRSASRSTGPRTAAGKARSSQNALKHGARARVLLPADDPAQYRTHVAGMLEEFAPASSVEATLVRELADVKWKLLRLARAEEAAAWRLFPDGEVDADFVLAWVSADQRLGGRMLRLLRQLVKARECRGGLEVLLGATEVGAERTDFAPAATELGTSPIPDRDPGKGGFHGPEHAPVPPNASTSSARCAERTDFEGERDRTGSGVPRPMPPEVQDRCVAERTDLAGDAKTAGISVPQPIAPKLHRHSGDKRTDFAPDLTLRTRVSSPGGGRGRGLGGRLHWLGCSPRRSWSG